ncbi:hypothetical protein [Nodularia sphaerocarpa]|uniref:hypothetical protein n=1 Tax=Nodularia sphaerocarpa TaxID=137816 RepID=UPI001EFB7ECC|nr:hypothetical protein [Nodularia sphaerocarpa]MDB9375867.1 hypothetical protein [Nodularia sphaerocarpa CS-585]MDB9376429.1 hypothetical protein [Nodularia sphaerocarpa CS-585A2]
MSSTEPTPNEPYQAETQLPTPSEPELEEVNIDTEIPEEIEESGAIFQAIGVIVGEVNLNEDGKNTVTIGNLEYPLFYIPQKRKVFDALTKEIETTGNRTFRLVVYPKAIHFPRKEQPHSMTFQLVGFDRGREQQTVSAELEDNEFKFSGLWQFIPVCQTPCISVFRNFTRERLEYIKQAEPTRKVKFMKASHLPLFWKDSPVRPFRFNPKAEKQDQGHPVFVSLKAKFLPGRNVFGFVALLAPPQETAPRFLKASKKDKATALQESKKNKATVPQPTKKDHPKPTINLPKPVLKKHSPEPEKEKETEKETEK